MKPSCYTISAPKWDGAATQSDCLPRDQARSFHPFHQGWLGGTWVPASLVAPTRTASAAYGDDVGTLEVPVLESNDDKMT